MNPYRTKQGVAMLSIMLNQALEITCQIGIAKFGFLVDIWSTVVHLISIISPAVSTEGAGPVRKNRPLLILEGKAA
jgi:hypothetical protein